MKNILEEAVSRFYDRDIDKLAECWHEDIIEYDLLTNKVIVTDKSQLIELVHEMLDKNDDYITIENQIVIGNLIIVHKSHRNPGLQDDIAICEIEDNLIKNVWEATFEGITDK